MYWRVFERYNNWRVIRLERTNISNEKDQYRVYETILHGIEARMNERILIGTFGAMRTDDEATREYYILYCGYKNIHGSRKKLWIELGHFRQILLVN